MHKTATFCCRCSSHSTITEMATPMALQRLLSRLLISEVSLHPLPLAIGVLQFHGHNSSRRYHHFLHQFSTTKNPSSYQTIDFNNKRLALTPTSFRGKCAHGHGDHDQNAPHLHLPTSILPLHPNSDLLNISLVDFLWYGYDYFQSLYTRLDFHPPQTIHTQQELLQFGNSQK